MNKNTFIRQVVGGCLVCCRVCNVVHPLNDPTPMDEFLRELKKFSEEHKNCKEKPDYLTHETDTQDG